MNYKQTAVAGTSWVRCKGIQITNPLEGSEPTPSIVDIPQGPVATFIEEKVITMDGADITIPAGSCTKPFKSTDIITIIHPDTGEPTGETVTHAKLYQILYSLYIQTAMERDAAVAAIVANTAAIEAVVT